MFGVDHFIFNFTIFKCLAIEDKLFTSLAIYFNQSIEFVIDYVENTVE